jgi:hypothetical protein
MSKLRESGTPWMHCDIAKADTRLENSYGRTRAVALHDPTPCVSSTWPSMSRKIGTSRPALTTRGKDLAVDRSTPRAFIEAATPHPTLKIVRQTGPIRANCFSPFQACTPSLSAASYIHAATERASCQVAGRAPGARRAANESGKSFS